MCEAEKLPFLGRRRSLGAETTRRENFRQKLVERFDSDYRVKAANHSAGRNESVAEVLCFLSLLQNVGDIPLNSVVAWSGAHRQAIKGDSKSDAAHCLPCQILINGSVPSAFVKRKGLDIQYVQQELDALFGKVVVLPKPFNLADSLAEASCLRASLVHACQVILRDTKNAGPRNIRRTVGFEPNVVETVPTGVDRKAVRAAYDLWVQESVRAFTRAGERANLEGVTYGEDYTEDVIYILDKYRALASVEPAKFSNDNIGRLESSMWLPQ
jgi:hypothetical protein